MVVGGSSLGAPRKEEEGQGLRFGLSSRIPGPHHPYHQGCWLLFALDAAFLTGLWFLPTFAEEPLNSHRSD
ncbi:hypothetical protein EBH_0071440 [Eimeria brunetti]|uniref:Uncharacterized protein n=1 Tax=Eimeria brunetti TaxID=51314 RepID=U6LD84_9EIME|nr:hypothetical protein EBH_0071440 [Eimeria brunetti]